MSKKNQHNRDLLSFVKSQYDFFFKEFNSKSIQNFVNTTRCALKEAHRLGVHSMDVCAANSLMVDLIVSKLYENFCNRGDDFSEIAKNNLSIIALAGYGREELCFSSDIDITFIYEKEGCPRVDDFIVAAFTEIMDGLRDVKLRFGPSYRTIEETFRELSLEVYVKTAFLDSRLICGNLKLYSKFNGKLKDMYLATKEEYVADLLRVISDKYRRNDWLAFIQEPNIKDGVGGLRDYQTILWVGRVINDLVDMESLVECGYLTLEEYNILSEGYCFIHRVRNQIHIYSEEESEFLDLNIQKSIASAFGFKDSTLFMEKVFQFFNYVYSLSKTIVIRNKIPIPKDLFSPRWNSNVCFHADNNLLLADFIIENGYLKAKNKCVFEENSIMLIKLFSYIQKYTCQLDDSLVLLIKENIGIIDNNLRLNKDAISSFLNIMSVYGFVGDTLFYMNMSEVLDNFIPEFKSLKYLVHNEAHYKYTIGIHSLVSIYNLDDLFFENSFSSEYAFYYKVLVNIKNPSLIYSTLFLLGIFKAYKQQNLSRKGILHVKDFLNRFRYQKKDIDVILFLLINHVEFSELYDDGGNINIKKITFIEELKKNQDLLPYLVIVDFCNKKDTSFEKYSFSHEVNHSKLYDAILSKEFQLED